MNNDLAKITMKDIRFINDIYESCAFDTLTRNLCMSEKQIKRLCYMICSQAFYSLKYQYNVD